MDSVIRLQGTEDTPRVIFDKPANLMEISGRSMPEDALKYYVPLQKWVDEYIVNPNPEMIFRIHLEYFNSKSLKQLVRIMIKLEQVIKTGKKIKILWVCAEGDELLRSKGEEIKSIVKLPFELEILS